jgi:rod shape-determining protein MreC
MEFLLGRYRNITLLLLVVFAQVIVLAWQVKNKSDVRIIRVWAVTAVTPIAQVVEDSRSAVASFFGNYVSLRDVRNESRKMRAELDALKLENQSLRSELAMADRVAALSGFQARTPSKMIPAQIIGAGTGAANRVAFVDRGSVSNVAKGMAVVTPDGIVGKVVEAYPTASQVLMVDDPGFAAGVVSQKNHVHGIIVGLGHGKCKVEYIQNEEKVEVGELFFTSGDDRVFPKGMPAARVTSVSAGTTDKQIFVNPIGLQGGPEEVLIVIEGVQQTIPDLPSTSQNVYIGPDPTPDTSKTAQPQSKVPLLTDADRLRERYQAVGDAQNHKFGEGGPGSIPPNFNLGVKQTVPKAAPAPRPKEVIESSEDSPDVVKSTAIPQEAAPAPKQKSTTPPAPKPQP